MSRAIYKPVFLLIAFGCLPASGPLWAQSYARISTIAGTGIQGFSGESRPAKEARRNHSADAAIHPRNGELYIADTCNHRIRRVDRSGIITTVAGSGSKLLGGAGDDGPATSAELHHPSGIAFDAARNLYIKDTDHHRIRRVNGVGTCGDAI